MTSPAETLRRVDAVAVFCASVTREREARGWTRRRLAAEAGLSPATVTNVEGKRAGINLDTAVALAAALGTRVGTLLGEEADR